MKNGKSRILAFLKSIMYFAILCTLVLFIPQLPIYSPMHDAITVILFLIGIIFIIIAIVLFINEWEKILDNPE